MADTTRELRLPTSASKTNPVHKVFKHIAAVRESGDRGTSVKNGMLNLAMTVSCWASWKEGSTNVLDILHGKPGYIVGAEGKFVVKSAHEGDDTAGLINPEPPAAAIQAFQENWEESGFAMKVNMIPAGGAIEFVGWKMAVEENGVSTTMAPDLPRLLGKLGVLTSPAALEAARNIPGKGRKTVESIYNAKVCSIALSFAPVLPRVAMGLMKRTRGDEALLDGDSRYRSKLLADFEGTQGKALPMQSVHDLVSSRLGCVKDEPDVCARLFGGNIEQWKEILLRI
jgi:hypothetical protein